MVVPVRAATSFADLATILGPRNPQASVCWCLSHRLDAKTNKSLAGPERGAAGRELPRGRGAPGVRAAGGAGVVGWAAAPPRAALPFARSRKTPPVDALPVWSVW